MGVTLTTLMPLLREHYHDSILDIFFQSDKSITPMMAGMETRAMSDGMGRAYVIPVQYAMGSSVSTDFATAQAISQGTTAGNSAARTRWEITPTTIEATAQWTRDALLGSRGEEEVLDLMQLELDAKIAKIRQRIAHYAYESGYGRIGTMSAVGTSQITFASGSVLNRIEVGDWLNASSTATGALRYATAARVTGINTTTNVCTMSADISGGSYTWGATDTVFFSGDHTDSTITNLVGLNGWVPTTAPTSALFGVTRTGIPALGGYRQDFTGLDHATGLIRGAQTLYKYGSKPSVCYLSAEDYGTLTCDKEAVKLVAMPLGQYEIGFDAFPLNSPAGLIKILPDAMMEQGTCWMGPFDDKKFAPILLYSDNGDLVNIDNIDGSEVGRVYNAAAYEMRIFFRGAMAIGAPGKYLCGYSLATS